MRLIFDTTVLLAALASVYIIVIFVAAFVGAI